MFLLNPRTNIYKYRENNVSMDLKMVPINRKNRLQSFPKKTFIEEKKPRVKEMLWGEPTWFLFHTLAEKIKEEEFRVLRKELLDFILRICNYLPCPTCAEHATKYLKGINFDAIQTKENLKLMLFSFHNEVNKNKGYELFHVNDLNEKYSSAVTINIVQNFFVHFSKKHYSIKMSVDGFHRQKLLKSFKSWLETHYHSFYA